MTSTLISLTKEDSDQYNLNNFSFDNIPLNILLIDGLSQTSANLKQISITSFFVKNIEYLKPSFVMKFGDYSSKDSVNIEISDVEIKNITFKSHGELLIFRHQTKSTTVLKDGLISDIQSQGIRLDAADKSLLPQ